MGSSLEHVPIGRIRVCKLSLAFAFGMDKVNITWKRTRVFNHCQERRRLARSSQHKAKLGAEEEHHHNIAADNESSLSATASTPVSPPPLLPRTAVSSAAAADHRRGRGRRPAASASGQRPPARPAAAALTGSGQWLQLSLQVWSSESRKLPHCLSFRGTLSSASAADRRCSGHRCCSA